MSAAARGDAEPKSRSRSRSRSRSGAGAGGAKRHSAARLAAVQALYEIEMSGNSMNSVLERLLRERPLAAVEAPEGEVPVRPKSELFSELVRGVTARRAELDDRLSAVLDDKWPLQRLELVLRCVLEVGIYELAARPEVPSRVVISEYVDLAHAFYAGAEPGMVNGILDRLARSLRPGELDPGDIDDGGEPDPAG